MTQGFKKLTQAEERIMHLLWELKIASIASIVEKMAEPKRAYNSVSTIVRILESKGFVGHRQKNKGYLYYPLMDKETYCLEMMRKLIQDYFNGSFKNIIFFYIKKNNMNTYKIRKQFEVN